MADNWQERFNNQLGQVARNFTESFARREDDQASPPLMVDDVTSSRGVDPDLRLVGNTITWGGLSYLNGSETLTIMITGRFAHPTGGCQPFYNPLVNLTVNTTNQTMTNMTPVYLDVNRVCVP